MASDRQSRLQQLLSASMERDIQRSTEADRIRSHVNDTGTAVVKAIRDELTVVSGNVELIGMRHVSDAVQRFSGNAQRAVDSAAQVLHRLSLLDRIGKGERARVDVHGTIVSLRTQLTQQSRADIKMEWRLESSKFSLRADPDEFGIIIREVLQNSLEAMPDGGTLTVTNNELRLWTPSRQEARWWVAIEVDDTGFGMSKQKCLSALAPVTRVNGQVKLALGLCLLDRFVNELEGVMDISSLEGQGTTITLLFPLQTTH